MTGVVEPNAEKQRVRRGLALLLPEDHYVVEKGFSIFFVENSLEKKSMTTNFTDKEFWNSVPYIGINVNVVHKEDKVKVDYARAIKAPFRKALHVDIASVMFSTAHVFWGSRHKDYIGNVVVVIVPNNSFWSGPCAFDLPLIGYRFSVDFSESKVALSKPSSPDVRFYTFNNKENKRIGLPYQQLFKYWNDLDKDVFINLQVYRTTLEKAGVDQELDFSSLALPILVFENKNAGKKYYQDGKVNKKEKDVEKKEKKVKARNEDQSKEKIEKQEDSKRDKKKKEKKEKKEKEDLEEKEMKHEESEDKKTKKFMTLKERKQLKAQALAEKERKLKEEMDKLKQEEMNESEGDYDEDEEEEDEENDDEGPPDFA